MTDNELQLLEVISNLQETIDNLSKELAERAEQVQQLKAILKQART